MKRLICFVVSAECVLAVSAADVVLGGEPAGPSPAQVTHPVQENELTTIRLTERAEQRLGIQTVLVEVRNVRRTRTYPGEVQIPPGRAVPASAPASGLLTLPPGHAAEPTSGMLVSRTDPVFMLVPGSAGDGEVFSASDRISLAKALADVLAARAEAEGQVSEAKVRVNAAKISLNRAETLQRENAGSRRSYDEARAEHELAQAAHAAAVERLAALENVLDDLKAGKQTAIPITAPLSGLIRTVHAASNQIVPSGAALFEVVSLDPIWVRVPIYVGDLARLRTDGPVQVRGLVDRPGAASVTAKLVHPPESGNSMASTVDLYYELPNPERAFRPGQRLGVVLPTQEQDSGPVVPRSAVLFDIHGGTWVYVHTAPQTYRRTRVMIRDVVDGHALLARGPDAGSKVVTDGSAELFGTEFGSGK